MSLQFEVNPVRLCFYRAETCTPDAKNAYFLFGEYDYLNLQDAEEQSDADASVLATWAPHHDELKALTANNIQTWMTVGIHTGALVRLDLGFASESFPSMQDLYDVSQRAYSILSDIGQSRSLSLISAGSYSVYVLLDLEVIALKLVTEK